MAVRAPSAPRPQPDRKLAAIFPVTFLRKTFVEGVKAHAYNQATSLKLKRAVPSLLAHASAPTALSNNSLRYENSQIISSTKAAVVGDNGSGL